MTKKSHRQEVILHEVNIHNRVLATDLSAMLNVSVDTIRRDIQDLHTSNELVKVHGGAVSKGYKHSESLNQGTVYAIDQKKVISNKAVTLINENSVILMSGGTTNMELARRLPSDLKATVFTPSLAIADVLLNHSEIEVIFIGGRISKDSQITVGGSAINTLSEINADICFMGTGYLHPTGGLTEFDWEVVQMKKAMIKASRTLVALTISEKLGTMQRYKICESQNLDMLITELDPSAASLEEYKNQNITIV